MSRWSRPAKVNIGLIVVLAIVVLIAAGFYLWRWSSARAELEQARAEMAQEQKAPPATEKPLPAGIVSP